MKKFRFLSFFMVILFLSCATTGSTVSSQANLVNYQLATISNVMGYGGSPEMMDMEVKIYDALSNSRLKMIGDNQIASLSDSEKVALLLVRFSASANGWESVVSINFVDYLTGRPVASCRGQATNWIGSGVANNSALDDALNQALKLFPR
jgi:hypothetical protein